MTNVKLIHDYAAALDEYHEALTQVVNHISGKKARRIGNLHDGFVFYLKNFWNPIKSRLSQARHRVSHIIASEGEQPPTMPAGEKTSDERRT